MKDTTNITMASLRLILSKLRLMLFIIVLCDANRDFPFTKLHVVKHSIRDKPSFKPGPWKKGHATFYEGSSSSFGGACNYKDVNSLGYGGATTALSSAFFKDGEGCGTCYEVKCVDSPQWCNIGGSLIVTGTDHCPPNPSLSTESGGWCNPPNEHFDIAKPVFNQIAQHKAGVVPVEYRRVPCERKGGIRFTLQGNPYLIQVLVTNVAGAGDVISLQVKGSKSKKWMLMDRDWGSTWKTSASLVGESLSFKVKSSDGRFSFSPYVTPKNWQFGQTYEGKNFK